MRGNRWKRGSRRDRHFCCDQSDWSQEYSENNDNISDFLSKNIWNFLCEAPLYKKDATDRPKICWKRWSAWKSFSRAGQFRAKTVANFSRNITCTHADIWITCLQRNAEKVIVYRQCTFTVQTNEAHRNITKQYCWKRCAAMFLCSLLETMFSVLADSRLLASQCGSSQ